MMNDEAFDLKICIIYDDIHLTILLKCCVRTQTSLLSSAKDIFTMREYEQFIFTIII